MKKRLLILNGQYLPGYKGGGPIQSCVNMVENLADQFDFYVLTGDRDFKANEPYKNIRVNEWNKIGSAKVFYMSPDMQTLSGFKKVMNEIDYDMLYLNGFYSPVFTIKPLLLRKFGKLKQRTTFLTPRGDFTGGSENKKIKKYTYIYLSKLMGLYSKVIWHATSNLEAKDIQKKFKSSDIFMVPNLPTRYIPKRTNLHKDSGTLRLVFVSRIFPKKNLKFALEVLKKVPIGNIIFDIYGPMEDETYWNKCKKVIKGLPENITVSYKGEVPHSEIAHVFEQYHAFFFPTLGENYGHVIIESMMNNCIALISKGVTPWDDYGGNGGFVEDISDTFAFVDVLEKLVKLNNDEYQKLVKMNRNYIEEKMNSKNDCQQYILQFNKQ
ncbi:glycosyltransferase family 4 protein [Peribacillus sp. SCS-26]|uniref:glycosyltransferase family 4 protein n=1 Tax=Paraperibacillus marinus TaxID=3115295 RepID=UPI0039057D28